MANQNLCDNHFSVFFQESYCLLIKSLQVVSYYVLLSCSIFYSVEMYWVISFSSPCNWLFIRIFKTAALLDFSPTRLITGSSITFWTSYTIWNSNKYSPGGIWRIPAIYILVCFDSQHFFIMRLIFYYIA